MDFIRDSSTGGNLGASLSAGLSSLTQQKLAQLQNQYNTELQRQRNEQGLAGYGFSPERARGMSNLNDDILKSMIMQEGRGQHAIQGLGGEQNFENAALAIEEATGIPHDQAMHIAASSRGVQPLLLKDLFQSLAYQQQPQTPIQETPEVQTPVQENIRAQGRAAKAQQEQQLKKAQLEGVKKKTELAAQETKRKEQALQHKIESDKKKTAIEEKKIDMEERKENKNLDKEARDFSAPYIEAAKKAELNRRDYQQIIKLAESGDLRSGNMQRLLDDLGLGDFLRNEKTQEAAKIFARLQQNVSGVFGNNSRITNFLEQTFQRSLPTLWNTPEGIIAISKLNMLADEGAIVRNDIRKGLLGKTGGKLSYDITDKIEELARPKLDKLEQKAMSIVSTPIDKNQQPLKLGSKFASLPDPKRYPKGAEISNKKTGQKWIHSGDDWIEVK